MAMWSSSKKEKPYIINDKSEKWESTLDLRLDISTWPFIYFSPLSNYSTHVYVYIVDTFKNSKNGVFFYSTFFLNIHEKIRKSNLCLHHILFRFIPTFLFTVYFVEIFLSIPSNKSCDFYVHSMSKSNNRCQTRTWLRGAGNIIYIIWWCPCDIRKLHRAQF